MSLTPRELLVGSKRRFLFRELIDELIELALEHAPRKPATKYLLELSARLIGDHRKPSQRESEFVAQRELHYPRCVAGWCKPEAAVRVSEVSSDRPRLGVEER